MLNYTSEMSIGLSTDFSLYTMMSADVSLEIPMSALALPVSILDSF